MEVFDKGPLFLLIDINLDFEPMNLRVSSTIEIIINLRHNTGLAKGPADLQLNQSQT